MRANSSESIEASGSGDGPSRNSSVGSTAEAGVPLMEGQETTGAVKGREVGEEGTASTSLPSHQTERTANTALLAVEGPKAEPNNSTKVLNRARAAGKEESKLNSEALGVCTTKIDSDTRTALFNQASLRIPADSNLVLSNTPAHDDMLAGEQLKENKRKVKMVTKNGRKFVEKKVRRSQRRSTLGAGDCDRATWSQAMGVSATKLKRSSTTSSLMDSEESDAMSG